MDRDVMFTMEITRLIERCRQGDADALALDGAVRALRMALEDVHSAKGIMHHSDRGIQYCSNEYIRMLQENGRETLERVIATYNGKRPHMSIGMITPDMAHLLGRPFKRKWKTYYKSKKKDRI
jgi:transposase InsO family protein